MGEILEFFSVYWVRIIIAVLGAYLMSSVNTSIIVTKIVLHKDIRTLGSGNAGFTNVLRCVGKVPAIITFVGDFLKGVISVAIAYFIMWGEPELQKYYLMCTAGLFAVVGHTRLESAYSGTFDICSRIYGYKDNICVCLVQCNGISHNGICVKTS